MPSTPDSAIIRSLQADAIGNLPFDEPVNPLTDGAKFAAIFFVETGEDNIELAVWRDGDDLRFRDTSNPNGGSGYTLSQLLASGGGGETNTASNVGGEIEVFKDKLLSDLRFRTLLADGGLNISQETDTIKFSTGFRRHFLTMGG